MAAVARGHGGDGAGEPPPPPHNLVSGHRGTAPRRGRGRGRAGEGRGGGGRTGVRRATKNVALRNAVRDFGPQPIEFDWVDQKTFRHVGDNHAWFSNYCGELIREFPLWYKSWYDIEEEKKAHIIPRLSKMFDLNSHMRTDRWKTITDGIEDYLATRYRDNKHDIKRDYWTVPGGAEKVDEIRRHPPPNMEPATWDKHIELYLDEKHAKRSKINKENRAKNKNTSRHGSRSLAASRYEYFQKSKDRQFPSLIQSFYDQRCKKGVWLQDEARLQYEEMCILRDLGANTPTGRAYTEEEILAKVLKGKQRGYIAARGRVLAGSGKRRLPMPRSGSYAIPEIDKMFAEKDKKLKEVEKESKETKAQLNAIMNVMKNSPDLWSQLMSQIPSQTEAGSGSGSGVGEGGSGSGSGAGDESGSDVDVDGGSDDESGSDNGDGFVDGDGSDGSSSEDDEGQ